MCVCESACTEKKNKKNEWSDDGTRPKRAETTGHGHGCFRRREENVALHVRGGTFGERVCSLIEALNMRSIV